MYQRPPIADESKSVVACLTTGNNAFANVKQNVTWQDKNDPNNIVRIGG
ncbi:hypothetical protein GA0061078_1655 [Bifidobacterium bohemicum]|uniref:Uncharacterized protein n=1 Tax=Bifidobacterium bohemicum DSM 22767 TaxID=1437606 RepID=A0A086ZH64_9BIFI|nr:hypothetical protein BBOH_0668 [Bifidobacterium bohemicum DSM 22767]SCC15866.1 hypothetical protein GA0061078_1655 [Bifidobacterium bohemicum]